MFKKIKNLLPSIIYPNNCLLSKNILKCFPKSIHKSFCIYSVDHNPYTTPINRDLPLYKENKNKQIEEFEEMVKSNFKKKELNNEMLFYYISMTQKLKISDYLKGYFNFSNYFIEDSKTASNTMKFKMAYLKIESPNSIKIVDSINNLILANENNINTKNELKSYISSLVSLLENEFKNKDDNLYLADISYIVKYLSQFHNTNGINIDASFIQEILNKYFNKLNSFEEIPLDIVKNNEIFLFRILDDYFMEKDENFNTINYQGKFNSTLELLLQKFLVTLTKYLGQDSIDLANGYFALSYFYLKAKDYERCEDFAIKCHAIIKFKHSTDKEKNINFLLPFYIMGELYLRHFKDFKQAYEMFSQAFDIISKHNNEIVNEKFEILKLYICDNLAKINCLLTDTSSLKRITENYEYCLNINNFDRNVLINVKNAFNTFIYLLNQLAGLYEKYNYFRKSYEIRKIAYEQVRQRGLDTSEYLSDLIRLFEYSDDYNIYLSYLNIQSNDDIHKEFVYSYLTFLLYLVQQSIIDKNYYSAIFIIDSIKANLGKNIEKIDATILMNLNIAICKTKILTNKFHEAEYELIKLNNFINIQEVAECITEKGEGQTYFNPTTQVNLIKLTMKIYIYFNLFYINLVKGRKTIAIYYTITCLKFINQYETLIKLSDRKSNFDELFIALKFFTANLYLAEKDINNLTLCLSKISRRIKKSEDSLVIKKKDLYLSYIEELRTKSNLK